ncbi:uncharacterized mitochondrial protein AtMg00310-like [Hevea brasiliensis]|uniref:uncharacterized mitochondrial protein AtMg00310-like n=1 Tax=Hevea brasiliensis TaxID=3981 RepID=UPI0025E26081|nr:uncharacterized mitochondrial protein AtMg00310-like [Hevea brasiliensis]
MLSQAGKDVLIKAVASAIPVYAMAYFKLPMSLCQEINKMLADFWCGQSKTGKKQHWISWTSMCCGKSLGGLGFRDLQSFNQALLAKQGWRIITNPNSLLARVLKGEYFHASSFSQASINGNPSWGWRSLLWRREILLHGMRWQVNNGNSILCKEDKWIPQSFPNLPHVKADANPHINWVSQLIDRPNCRWNYQALNDVFHEDEIRNIMAIPISMVDREDRISWHLTQNGTYNVKSSYHIAHTLKMSKIMENVAGPSLNSQANLNSFWKKVWSTQLPP